VRARLGAGQLAPGEGLGEPRQRTERVGDADALAGRAEVEAHAPAEPLRTGAEAGVPPAAGVELADEGEQARGGGVEMGGELGNLVAEPVQLAYVRRRFEQHGRCGQHDMASFGCPDSTPR
jgi:hypothetical protein